MAGLRREDLMTLSPSDLAQKLEDVGLPKTLTQCLEAKNVNGSTLLLFEQEDIRYEFSDLSLEDRIYLRNFLREKGVLTAKLQRALENKRYQEKCKSLEGDQFQFEAKKQKTRETDEGTPANINDNASLERHSRRLQDELKKSSPDEEVVKELMTAEFIRRRIFVKQLDARTRVRDTLTKYPVLAIGHQIEEELVRILRYERKLSLTVEKLIDEWRSQSEKLKGFLSQRFSLRGDEITDDIVLKNLHKIFPTKLKKKGQSQLYTFVLDADDENQKEIPSKNDPYILMHWDKEDQDNLVFTIMLGVNAYCSVDNNKDSLGHAMIQLLAMYYVFHFEYPATFRNIYFFLQQFILGDTDLPSNMPRIINGYHAAIQQYLVFVNSQK